MRQYLGADSAPSTCASKISASLAVKITLPFWACITTFISPS